MKIKAASGIMLILFLTFTLGISVNECQGFERWVPYVPSADLKFWMSNGISYINVSMTFPDSGFHVSDWGTVVRDKGQIWADSKIWDWTGYSFLWIITLSHTYDLGRLEEGNYTFTFKAWGFDVENVSFTVPAKVQLLLETDKDVYILGENVTITLRNIGTEPMEIWGHPAWGIYTYPEESFVFPKYYAFLIWSLEPGENDTITWDQYNAFTHSLVDPGMYVVRDTMGWGLSAFFEITHLPPPPADVFEVVWDGEVFNVVIESNSTVSDFEFRQGDMEIRFNVTGLEGTVGFCNVTIPMDLMKAIDEPWLILVDGDEVTPIQSDNVTHTFLYFTYTHTIHNIKIRGTWVVPEFPTWTPILLTLIILAVVIAIYKRRLLKTPTH